MNVWGIVNDVLSENIFSIIRHGKREYFYFRKNMVKKYSKYIKEGVKVVFECDDTKTLHKDLMAYAINKVILISETKKRENVVYYDLYIIQRGIKKIIDTKDNLLFIDFEMNMQDYKPINGFVQEIIEAGYLVCDYKQAIYDVKHQYIKPSKFRFVTNRTMKFLGYSQETLEVAISFKKFYEEFVRITKEYNPIIFVWGKSDITQLKKCVEINHLEWHNFRFVDLLQLHMNYFGLKEAPGLFNTWEKYNKKELPEQTHDSLEDAIITKDVYFSFRKRIKTRR